MPPTKLRDGSTTNDRRLDRLKQPDPRNKDFPVRTVLPTTFRSYTWSCLLTLDQGMEGACVGFAWTHELIARPKPQVKDNRFAREKVYWEAQKIDPWDGGAYPGAGSFYEGTSVLAGAQVIKSLGYMPEYRWAFTLNDLRLALGYAGPAVLGLDWYEGMFRPSASGQIRPTGSIMGGHAILAYRVDEANKRIWLHNSWGSNWGVTDRVYGNGNCWLTFDDMARLLTADADACVPVTRLLV